jgi:hypothetical protein
VKELTPPTNPTYFTPPYSRTAPNIIIITDDLSSLLQGGKHAKVPSSWGFGASGDGGAWSGSKGGGPSNEAELALTLSHLIEVFP